MKFLRAYLAIGTVAAAQGLWKSRQDKSFHDLQLAYKLSAIAFVLMFGPIILTLSWSYIAAIAIGAKVFRISSAQVKFARVLALRKMVKAGEWKMGMKPPVFTEGPNPIVIHMNNNPSEEDVFNDAIASLTEMLEAEMAKLR